MFDSMPEDLDPAATAAAVGAAHRDILDRDCHIFQLAAHWADLHHPDSRQATRTVLPGAERGKVFGGDGTPEVLEFAPEELGTQLETTANAARTLMADALDVRHRLPQLWAMVLNRRVRVWRVRKVAQATRHLDHAAAGRVDRAVAGTIALLSWGRFETRLDAAIIAADPALADEQARRWEAERFVRAGRTRNGLRTIVARAAAGDAILYLATVNRIAEILAARGDTDTADVRRSKAIGILAQPALALQLLYTHRNDPDDTEPTENLNTGYDEPFDDPESEPEPEPASESGRGGLVIPPPPIDPATVRPTMVFYVHLAAEAVAAGGSAGVGRFEQVGPVTVDQIRRFLRATSCDIRVQPVIDLNQTPPPVDAYEIPDRHREHLQHRSPASSFPYSPATSRRRDLDHTSPYLQPSRGGPPGQTRIGNLGPLSRHEHRLKTHTRWHVRQPTADTFLWRSPHGAHYLVTPAGTLSLGDGLFAHDVWDAAEWHCSTSTSSGSDLPV